MEQKRTNWSSGTNMGGDASTQTVQRGIYSRSPVRGNWTEHSCTLVQVGLSRPRTLPQPSRNCRCSAGLLQIRHLQKASKSSIMLLCAAGQSTKTRGEGRERRGEALMAHPARRVSWMGRVCTAAWISSLSTGDSRSKPGQKYQNKLKNKCGNEESNRRMNA